MCKRAENASAPVRSGQAEALHKGMNCSKKKHPTKNRFTNILQSISVWAFSVCPHPPSPSKKGWFPKSHLEEPRMAQEYHRDSCSVDSSALSRTYLKVQMVRGPSPSSWHWDRLWGGLGCWGRREEGDGGQISSRIHTTASEGLWRRHGQYRLYAGPRF